MVISIKYKFKSNWNVWFWLIWHGARENSPKIAILLRNCIHLVNGCFDDKLLFEVTFNLLQDTLQLKLNSIEQTWCLEIAYTLLPTSMRTSYIDNYTATFCHVCRVASIAKFMTIELYFVK